MPIIAVANLKGGVGKSTITQNLAVCLRQKNKSVCIVDTDTEQKSTAEWGERREQNELPNIPIFLVDENTLASRTTEVADEFDFVIVDGSPALSEITTKIVLIADLVVVPVMPSGNDFGALQKFLVRYNDTRAIQKRRGVETAGMGVVLNVYDGKIIVNRTIHQAIEQLGINIFDSKMANRVSYREANLTGYGVAELTDKKAIAEIEGLTMEVLALLNK